MIRHILSLAVLAVLFSPARAADHEITCPPGGQSIDQTLAQLQAHGDFPLDLVTVNGDGFDQVLVAQFSGQIVVGLFERGCAVSPPIALGAAVPLAGA